MPCLGIGHVFAATDRFWVIMWQLFSPVTTGFSALIAGGGLRMGQVIGRSDKGAARPATEPFNPSHLLSTIMHTVFDLGKLRLDQSLPRDVANVVQSGEPILPLMA